MVDYHFGRLAPQMNRAIEEHIRTCPRCKAEGLASAPSARQSSGRKLRRVRGGKPLIGSRGRRVILAILVLIAFQIVLFQITRGQAQSLVTILDQWRAPGVSSALGVNTANLRPIDYIPGATDGSAIALSMDGQTVALAQSAVINPNNPSAAARISVSLWSVKNSDQITSIPWAAADAPSGLAWSADGSELALASSSQVAVWSSVSHTIVATLTLPTAPAALIYDVSQRTVVNTLDSTTLFARGTLVWGADGALAPAPVGAAGPTSVTAPWTPTVSLWSSAGAHIFGDGKGGARLGVSPADAEAGDAILDWSPDGRYLLWASLSVPASGAGAITPPNDIVAPLVAQVQKASANGANDPGRNDALLWFAPDGSRVAVCNRTQPNASVAIYDIASGKPAAILGYSCANMTTHSAQWSLDGTHFLLSPQRDPIQIYQIPSSL
jgi:dipeptidyl aminopeptidase/acylaminoacyl peptidase